MNGRHSSDPFGGLARLGLLVIHNDGVPEPELRLVAPPGVAVFTARFQSPRRKGHAYEDDIVRSFAESADLLRGAEMLGSMPLDHLLIAYASGALLAGMAWDERVTTRVSEQAGGIPCVAAATALVAASRALGLERPMLALPAWFGDEVLQAASNFAPTVGWTPSAVVRIDAGSRWRGLAPHEIYDRGANWQQKAAENGEAVAAAFPADADGVVVLGSGLRIVEAIESLESRLGVPVVAPQQALLWYSLRVLGIDERRSGFGTLLASRLSLKHPQEVS